MKQYLYKNKVTCIISCSILIILGLVIAYIYYGVEPWETIGGFLCGLGFMLLLISISLKKTIK